MIELSKKYLSETTGQSLTNAKLRVHVEDGFEFLRKCARRAKAAAAGDASGGGVDDPDVPADGLFDVIITDCTDAVEGSPAGALYEAPFYELISDALRPDGISCALGAYDQLQYAGSAGTRMFSAVWRALSYSYKYITSFLRVRELQVNEVLLEYDLRVRGTVQ